LIKGLYTAASGMMLQMQKQDVVANNIANVNTGGYKKDNVLCQSFPNMLISRLGESQDNAQGREEVLQPVVIGPLGTGAVVKDIITDHGLGTIKVTNNQLDLAISNEGYFAVQTPQGERFTRDGSFKINQEGILVTNQGNTVMSTDNQPINIVADDGTVPESFRIDKNGSVLIDNQEIAKLKVVNFADKRNLEKQGAWMRDKGNAYTVVEQPGIVQGYLELSNVNVVQEMVKLINVVRAYESCQKVVQAEDEITGVAIDQVGANQ